MNNNNSLSVLVLVPAYNASMHLPELIPRLKEYVCPENLLFVNDGSTDNTLDILKEEEENFISFNANRGKGAALIAGFEYAIKNNYRSVLTIDADLQHLPEEIPAFFANDDGKTVIIGTRKIKLSVMPPDRCLSNWVTSLIVSIFSTQRVRDSQCGYRLLPTSLLKVLPLMTVGYDLESEMLFKTGALGYRIAEVPISTIYDGSESFINPFKDSLRFIRQIWRRIWA